jgi:hypothetical protein
MRATPHGRLCWLVTSATTPGVEYCVDLEGEMSCTCASHLLGTRFCRHIEYVLSLATSQAPVSHTLNPFAFFSTEKTH